jgi:tight adherence protein B
VTISLAAAAVGMAILCWPLSSMDRRRLYVLVEAGRLGRVADPARMPPRRRLRVWRSGRILPQPAVAVAVIAMSGAAVGVRYGVGVGLAAAVIPALAWRLLRSRALRRKHTADDKALNAALGLVCAELAAGSRTDHALLAAADVAGRFDAAFRAAAQAVEEASDPAAALVSSTAGSELHPVAAALEVAVRTGAPIAAVLDRARSDVADRMAMARDLAAAVSGARASAALLAVLPALGIAMGMGLGAAPLQVLLRTSVGHGVLVAGTVLTAVGVLWMERLISGAERPP